MAEISEERSGDLLARWRQGDQYAAAELFRRYARRLIALARSRLSTKLAARVDAEDIVQSAYRSFFAGARAGQYDLRRGGDLWRLLVTITLHKLYLQVERNSAAKRGVDRERALPDEDQVDGIPAQLLAREPSPIEAAALADELAQFMQQLEPVERRLLELRLQGYDAEEMAADTHLSLRTVYRCLERFKTQLEQLRCQQSGS
jgi:RNA polymerase sigma-70 factor (ECF subfamily)